MTVKFLFIYGCSHCKMTYIDSLFTSSDNKMAKYFPDASRRYTLLHEVLFSDGGNIAFVMSMPFLLFIIMLSNCESSVCVLCAFTLLFCY